jgi:triphosphoribosyl-dephospho-CoA synthase
LALRSLYAELALYPKPGLVSFHDAGAHRDMNAGTFVRSLLSLRRYFGQMAIAGAGSAGFVELRRLGLCAEARMMRATGGVNTHRGAIFVVGLLAACAGAALAERGSFEEAALREIARTRWTRDLALHARARRTSHGRRASERYGVAGACGEAILGFPKVFDVALAALREALARGAPAPMAQLHALFSLLATVDDTNVLHRGGPDGLERVKSGAREFLARGSVFAASAGARAVALHRAFSRERLSPGGSADLLAAAWFIHLLQSAGGALDHAASPS